MLQGEHSAILSTFIKLPFVITIIVCLFGMAILHRLYTGTPVIHTGNKLCKSLIFGSKLTLLQLATSTKIDKINYRNKQFLTVPWVGLKSVIEVYL